MYHQSALAGSDSPPNLSSQHPPSPLTRSRDCIPVIFSSAPASAPAPSGLSSLLLCTSGACQGPPRLSSPPYRLCHQRPISMTARPCRTWSTHPCSPAACACLAHPLPAVQVRFPEARPPHPSERPRLCPPARFAWRRPCTSLGQAAAGVCPLCLVTKAPTPTYAVQARICTGQAVNGR